MNIEFHISTFVYHLILTRHLYFIKVLFEMTGNTGRTPKGLDTREWQFKGTAYTFVQNKNPGNKTWESGVWNKKLSRMRKNNLSGIKFSKADIARIQCIIDNRLRDSKIAAPVKGMAFFPFEEDLWHHINECFVTISAGCTISFFDNPFVRDLLKGLAPRHRVAYHLKLVRLQRCCNDILQKEVRVSLQSIILYWICILLTYLPISDLPHCYRVILAVQQLFCSIDI